MANRQPGHYTFGRRNSVDIFKIYDMVGDEFSDPIFLPYTRVYDTDFKIPKDRCTQGSKGSWVGDNQVDITDRYGPTGNPGIPTGINFYTGVVVALNGTGTTATNWGTPILGKAPTFAENVIGVVAGGTGPTLGNLVRGPAKSGGFTGPNNPKNEGLVIQYSGQCNVLLAETDSVSIRGRFLETSTGVSGTAASDVTAGIYQFALCLTNSFASGMTAGHGPGLTGLLGNYVNATIRPVETQ
jgi:hypothetical protein